MNSYFFKMTTEERTNILDQHRHIYDGYVTNYGQSNEQPLYVQDMANDKGGITLKNNGEVTPYTNLRINEMRHDGKSTGLFSDEEPMEEDYMTPDQPLGDVTPTFESEEDEGYFVSLGEQLDMIGDGPDDMEHGVFGHDHEGNEILVSPEVDLDDSEDIEDFGYFGVDDDFDDEDGLVFDFDSEIINDMDGEEGIEDLFGNLRESLDMFKRFTKYN